MSDSNFMAIYTGTKDGPNMQAWQKLPEAERNARQQQGMAAWHAWMERHRDVVVESGGPLGKTKRVTKNGVADTSNEISGFVIVRAQSHEAAAKLFEGHPHFSIFPGEGVEIMPVLPVPGG
ncbi:MAG: hypothetical protein GC166_11410 [Alphaproteobacteria bacterium]|nr:hypothetical protein [Alphaproteobacteria bacterium]